MIPIFVDGDSRNLITYASSPSISLNNPSDNPDNTYLVEDIDVSPAWDAMIEPLPDRDGLQTHSIRRMQIGITIRGWVKATSHAALYDKIRALNKAFDPVLNYLADTSEVNKGFLALDFNIPTTDTATYASGLIPARFYARPTSRPVPLTTKFDGLAARFIIRLHCADPRMYWQTLTTDSASGASPQTVNITNLDDGEYPIWPTIQIVFVTAPSGTMTITGSQSSESITLVHTQLAANKTLDIDTQAKTVEYSDGTNKIAAVHPSSKFFYFLPETGTTVTFTGFPSDATLRVIHRRAFA